jgi:hypothetical protein
MRRKARRLEAALNEAPPMSRAGLAQALQTLRRLGWIHTDRRRYVVRDMAALRARAA